MKNGQFLFLKVTLILYYLAAGAFPHFSHLCKKFLPKPSPGGSSWAKRLFQLMSKPTGGQRAALTSDPSTLAGSVGIFWGQLLDPEGGLVCRELLQLQVRCEGMELGFYDICPLGEGRNQSTPMDAALHSQAPAPHVWLSSRD